jgi:prepilin-type N-terminal cleavage/methylation domain-containing protein
VMSKGERRYKKGFTLVEVLLSIAVIAVIAVFSVPVFQRFQVKNDLDIAASTTAQSLRRSQVLAQAVDGDTTWGVKILSGSIVIFKGASYAARDTSFDETTTFPSSITPSGLDEVVFSKLFGEPSSTGSVTLTSSNADVRTVTINAKGTVTL